MQKERLAAFSDGVIAIIITIMVLELKVPHGADFAALAKLWPVFLSYVLSFLYVAIYWNNHHHLLHAVHRVDGRILWANMHLLFWLSLIPFATGWMGENHFAQLPVALYGIALLMSALAYHALQLVIMRVQGKNFTLARALGRDVKGKASLSCCTSWQSGWRSCMRGLRAGFICWWRCCGLCRTGGWSGWWTDGDEGVGGAAAARSTALRQAAPARI